MGGSISSAIDAGPYTDLEPGTYRITHAASKTVIKIPDQDQFPECVPEPMRKHHTWFVEQDDDGGYRFKNCKFGTYLGMDESGSSSVCANSRPQSWKIYTFGVDDIYLLRLAGQSRHLERSETKGPDGGNLTAGGAINQNGAYNLSGNAERGTDALAEEISNQRQELLNAYRELSTCQSALLQREATIQSMAQELRQKDMDIETLRREMRENQEAMESRDIPRPRSIA
ncbi:hypothetical protein FRC09_003514 [Ceratobasidium sp. 395]|nr:hypothetical protein FRC09_003514 [Ceratobasidium sp. 395]